MKKIISFVLCIAVAVGVMQTTSSAVYAGENDTKNKYGSIYCLEDNFLTMGTFSAENGGIPNSALETVTGTYNCVISAKPLYLPYGGVFDFSYDSSVYKNFSARIYKCDKDGRNNEEITSSYFKPSNEAFGKDGDYLPVSFVCNEEEGMYINIRIIPWSNEYNKEDVERFNSYVNVYDLTEIYAPVFDNSTIKQCWDNTAMYEAWATNCIIYNKANDLYYFFYSPQSSHTTYDGLLSYRISRDLINWSEPTQCVKENTTNEAINAAQYCDNGDIVISTFNAKTDKSENCSYFYRSTDNGKTWVKEDFVLDGKNATAKQYRTQRMGKLSDGRLITCYYDGKESSKQGILNGICISDDNGKTWTSSNYKSNTNYEGEFSFALLNNGNILCVERAADGIYATVSEDNGKSFATEKKIPISAGSGLCYKTPPEVLYNEKTDDVEIYWIDRYATGGLCCSFSTGCRLSSWICDDNEYIGFSTKVASLGENGNNDEGYPEIIVTEDGTVKCFFYQKATDGKNKTSFYCIDGKIKHYKTYQVEENVVPSTCTQQGECDIVTRCCDCDKEIRREHIVLKKSSHKMVKSVMPATTSSNGFTVHSCSNCGYTYISEYKQSISGAALSKSQYTYSGKTFKPVVTVKDSVGKILKNNIDYSLVYSKNKQVGTAKVKIVFKGAYSGSITKEFKIVPKTTSFTKVAAGAKEFKVTWKKQTNETTGYQIRYSTSSKMTNAKALRIEGSAKANATVKELKSKRKYYVQIRTYKTVGGKRYYSAWSKGQSVTTK